MSAPELRIIPYEQFYEPALAKMERESAQGKLIQLEMVRKDFLDRSVVFQDYGIFLAIHPSGDLMGVAAGAALPILVNGARIHAGLGYDLRVANKYRGMGIAKILMVYLYKNFHLPQKVDGLYLTMKSSNQAVYRASHILGQRLYQYSFYYLTIPVYKLRGSSKTLPFNTSLSLDLFGAEPTVPTLSEEIAEGVYIWHTHRMYQIKVLRMHPLLRATIAIANFMRNRTKQVPVEGSFLGFSLLFLKDPMFEIKLGHIAQKLSDRSVNYIVILCKKNEPLYKRFKPLAINVLPYSVVSTFPMTEKDNVTLDVRCI